MVCLSTYVDWFVPEEVEPEFTFSEEPFDGQPFGGSEPPSFADPPISSTEQYTPEGSQDTSSSSSETHQDPPSIGDWTLNLDEEANNISSSSDNQSNGDVSDSWIQVAEESNTDASTAATPPSYHNLDGEPAPPPPDWSRSDDLEPSSGS